jgi:Flp pilus assembly protein TadG
MQRDNYNPERGVATIEFALTASFFLMMIVAVVAGGHFFWTHNALVEATRRGARYAAMQCKPADTNCPGYSAAIDRIRNVVLYNSPNSGTQAFVPNLQASNIIITYSKRPGTPSSPDSEDFGVGAGTVSVKIQNYDYKFALSPTPFPMPPYETTVRGESAGYTAGQNLCP